jgi:hypothetical protein
VRVSWLSLKTKVDSLSMVWPQNHWDSFSQFGLKTGGDDFPILASKSRVTFPGLDLKTNICGLVIWASKSSRQFLGLSLKTM